MSNKNRKKAENKKSESKFKSWVIEVLTDLIVGIILLIIDKLLN